MPVHAEEVVTPPAIQTTTHTVNVKESSEFSLEVKTGKILKLCIDKKIIPPYSSEGTIYKCKIPYGKYTMDITHTDDLEYSTSLEKLDIVPYLKYSKVTMLVGFTEELPVLNQNAKVKYASTDKKVATVTSAGCIKAKAPGKCVIVVSCGSVSLRCPVKVLANSYSDDKPTISSTDYYKTSCTVYSMTYDKGGDLVVKYRICNNTPVAVVKKKLTLSIADVNGSTILDQAFKQTRCNIPAYKSKDFTLSIPKTLLGKDLIALRDCTPTLEAKFSYNF